jgi:hypothetical protein
MEEEGKDAAPNYGRTAVKISIEGSSTSEGGDVTLEISARSGCYIGIVMQQGEGDDFINAIDLVLTHSDFLRFLTLAQTLLSIAVEGVDDDD